MTEAVQVRPSAGPVPITAGLTLRSATPPLPRRSSQRDAGAAQAARGMRANAFATGKDVAFASPNPSLHTTAHEAAHVVQQRGQVQLQGGVGQRGDRYEQHADAVADRVVRGGSAEALLDAGPRGPASGAGGVARVQLEGEDDLSSGVTTNDAQGASSGPQASAPSAQTTDTSQTTTQQSENSGVDVNAEVERILKALNEGAQLRVLARGFRALACRAPEILAQLALDPRGLLLIDHCVYQTQTTTRFIRHAIKQVFGITVEEVVRRWEFPKKTRITWQPNVSLIYGWGPRDLAKVYKAFRKVPIQQVKGVVLSLRRPRDYWNFVSTGSSTITMGRWDVTTKMAADYDLRLGFLIHGNKYSRRMRKHSVLKMTALHELGHAIDGHLHVMNNTLDDPERGGWREYGAGSFAADMVLHMKFASPQRAPSAMQVAAPADPARRYDEQAVDEYEAVCDLPEQNEGLTRRVLYS